MVVDGKKLQDELIDAVKKCWVSCSITPMSRYYKRYAKEIKAIEPERLTIWSKSNAYEKWIIVCKLTCNLKELIDTKYEKWAKIQLDRYRQKIVNEVCYGKRVKH